MAKVSLKTTAANRCCRDGVATAPKLLVDQLGLDNILSKIVKISHKWIIYCQKKIKLNNVLHIFTLFTLSFCNCKKS